MADVNIYEMGQTWNAGATAFTAIKMNVTDTASAAASHLLDLMVNSGSKFYVRKDGLVYAANNLTTEGHVAIQKDDGAVFFGTSTDLVIRRDAANTLAQRNGVNGQQLNIYSTYTDASNYRRIEIYNGGIIKRGAGTGIDNTVLYLYNVGAGPVTIGTSDTERWKFLAAGHFTAALDNTYDIGASGATRPRQLFLGPSTTAHANINLPATGVAPTSPVDGDIWFDGTNLKIQIGAATKTVTVA
ncbi:MAG: hypothetical protein WC829_02405 [Hyphomicrobium sp.]|jgi:hypothetical protein